MPRVLGPLFSTLFSFAPRVGAAAILLMPGTVSAVLFYDTDNAAFNTTAPAGGYADSGWQYEGYYGGFLGTMIAPQYFITVQHVGPQGGTFVHAGIFNGGTDVTYTIDMSANGGAGYWDIAGTDLRIVKINEAFPYYAPLYTGSGEVGMSLVTVGRGGPRGAEVLVSGNLHGWEHGLADGIARWGTNIVSDTTTIGGLGDLLVVEFDDSGPFHTIYEATLSSGDSGGGVFVNDGGIWKLAGVNYSVDGLFDTNNVTGDGSEFGAGLFDRGGLYQGSDAQGWNFIPNLPLDNPSSFYATRISAHATTIQSIAVVPEPDTLLLAAVAGLGALTRRRR